jgi:hypothetical protein
MRYQGARYPGSFCGARPVLDSGRKSCRDQSRERQPRAQFATDSENLSAQLGQTLLYSLRLGLELGQVCFELDDLLGLAPEPSLESVVPVLSAMVTPAATATAAATSAFAATATPSPPAMASRVPITVVVAVMPMAAMVFVMVPIMMMLVVFVSLVGGHEQPLFRPGR